MSKAKGAPVIHKAEEGDAGMGKVNIGVLFGGCSSEYGISLQSAYAVIQHMNRDKYNPVLIGITRDGRWLRFHGDIQKIADDSWHTDPDSVPAILSPCRGIQGLIEVDSGKRTQLDAALPVLHGKNGEDGTVQGLLELAGIPVVGCGALASALCMDKYRAHQIIRSIGIATPDSFLLNQNQAADILQRHADAQYMDALRYADTLGYPLFVKPVRGGSSIGITYVANPAALPPAIALALEHDEEIILEEAIPGFEVGCAVLGKDTLTVGRVDEIEIPCGFLDYAEKYHPKTAKVIMPARMNAACEKRIQETAKRIYKALGCAGFARVDMFLKPSGEIVFNEVNTIPGFTALSRFPSMMQGIGYSFSSLLDKLIGVCVTT